MFIVMRTFLSSIIMSSIVAGGSHFGMAFVVPSSSITKSVVGISHNSDGGPSTHHHPPSRMIGLSILSSKNLGPHHRPSLVRRLGTNYGMKSSLNATTVADMEEYNTLFQPDRHNNELDKSDFGDFQVEEEGKVYILGIVLYDL